MHGMLSACVGPRFETQRVWQRQGKRHSDGSVRTSGKRLTLGNVCNTRTHRMARAHASHQQRHHHTTRITRPTQHQYHTSGNTHAAHTSTAPSIVIVLPDNADYQCMVVPSSVAPVVIAMGSVVVDFVTVAEFAYRDIDDGVG